MRNGHREFHGTNTNLSLSKRQDTMNNLGLPRALCNLLGYEIKQPA